MSFNKKFSEEVDIVKPEAFTCKSFDGWQIEGWIMKPQGFKEARKYPMILNVHGGPHSQYGYNVSALFQYFAANGYAVMYTNPRGSTGYGQKFSDGCVGDLGGGDYKDVMACVDYVLEKYTFIDSQKLGVTGGSYGGYLTNWITTHTNRFKAAVPVASISNLISDWGADANPDWFESDGGFMPLENYEKAWDMSPLKYVADCKTPTLFIHGAWDFCVNLGQAEEMYTALKKLGVDAVLAIYPNEGHGLTQPEHVVDYHQRALAWFDKYLKASRRTK
jgi:acylaminoacyl-peptidase